VVVRYGSADDLPEFNRMMRITGQRDGFGIHAPEYYRTAFELFAPEQACLAIAEYEGKPLAGVMAFALGGRAAYFYGASSDEERSRMPNYSAQWAAIQWAKSRDCTSYDLWGIPDFPETDLEKNFTLRNDGLWGVYRFKRGFGGRVRRTVGTVDRVYNRRLHRLYRWWRSRD